MSLESIETVLITGHDGYIGTVLSDRLLQSGFNVKGLDIFWYDDCWFGNKKNNIQAIHKNVFDVELSDLYDVDAVIHLAALSNDPLGQLSKDLTLKNNFEATVKLASLSKQAGVKRFLYASSCSLYGKSDKEWVDETSLMLPLTAYAESKVKSEKELLKLADHQFKPILLRCATVFGFSPKLRIDLVVNNLTAQGVASGKIKLLSDGTPWRPLIHVDDLASVYEFFLNVPLNNLRDFVFNIGFDAQNYQVSDIASQVIAAITGASVEFMKEPDKDSRSYRVCFDRFQLLSRLKPKWDLAKGIQQLIEAYKEHGFSFPDLSGRKYIRLNQINYLSELGKFNL